MILFFILSSLLLFTSAEVRVAKEHTSRLPAPQGWDNVGRADASQTTRITIAITQTNLDQLEDFFWRVSDPQNKQYGKYLSLQEVNKMVAPSRLALSSLSSWLQENSIHSFTLSPSGDFMIVYALVGQIEKLLDTDFHVYRHSETGMELVRALGPYTVPISVDPHIDFIGGLTHFPKNTRLAQSSPKLAPLAVVTPAFIKTFFGIPANISGTQSNNSQAVAQFLEQYYAPSDLSKFQNTYNLPKQAVTKVVGPNQPSNPGIEASLDIEYIMGVAPGVDTWFVYTSGLHEGQEPFLDWVVNMSSDPTTPWVHSVSYGDDEDSVTYDYASRVNVEFQKYGAIGRSILFASGDDGTGCDSSCKLFVPNWPASSPYVTTVGGIIAENSGKATGDAISSGGFSNYFPQPSYQQAAVKAYLSAHTSPPPSAYNATGRAMPDIASFSENVQIVWGGDITGVAGTSCAAPVVSAIITLLNDARMAAGKSTLGFLNPFIYQTAASTPSAFIDITTGSNPSGCCSQGFKAATGWDPITGVGAPNFPNLKQAALSV